MVCPIGKTEPGAIEYPIVTEPTPPVAVARNPTAAPAALVASAVTSAGTVSVGGAVLRTVTVNVPIVLFPAPSLAVTVTTVAPIAKVDPDGAL